MNDYLFLLLIIAGAIIGLWVMQLSGFLKQSRENGLTCPYCDKAIPSNALICPNCNGAIKIGSSEAIRRAILENPSMIGKDSESRINFQIEVEKIDQELKAKKEKLEKQRIESEIQRVQSLSPMQRFIKVNINWIILFMSLLISALVVWYSR